MRRRQLTRVFVRFQEAVQFIARPASTSPKFGQTEGQAFT
jgi:hypothetical protein